MLIKMDDGSCINTQYIVQIFADDPFITMAHPIDETGRRAKLVTENDIAKIISALGIY